MSFKENWNEVPKPIQVGIYIILGTVAAFFFGLLFGWIIVWLWNWLMPMIFGLPTITFWQGAGLFILAKILFGGFNSGSGSSKSSKKEKKYTTEWNADNWGKKMERWEHYDEWWKAEGKAAFNAFADNQNNPVPAGDAAVDKETADTDDTKTTPKPEGE